MDQFYVDFPWWNEKIIVILQKIIIFCNNITTMDYTLFAYCLTDGEFDNFTEQQKKSILHVIKNMAKEYRPTESNMKTPKKYQNNEGVQNNRKVSK